MNRGILAIGVVGIVATLINVFAASIFAALACFDACSSALASVQNQPLAILVYFVWLAPALALILAGWIWQLVGLRRMGARGTLTFVATFPLIAVAVMAGVALIAAASEGIAPLDFTPLNLWMGEFGLVVWPLLVSVVAFALRQRAGIPIGGPTMPPTHASPTA